MPESKDKNDASSATNIEKTPEKTEKTSNSTSSDDSTADDLKKLEDEVKKDQ